VVKKHYDIIILGECLGSRIAGALLAKKGKRVLLFKDSAPAERSWILPSLHLDRILDLLGGRSCLIAPTPFQVCTHESRLEFHGSMPLEEELRREFPDSFPRVESILKELASLGGALEAALWDSGGLPLLGMAGRRRFALKRMRRRISAKLLSRPLADFLSPVAGEAAGSALATLFSGLSLAPISRLSMGEAAFLWHGVAKSDGVSRSGLDELLFQRFEQFHGEEENLSRIREIRAEGRRVQAVFLQNGSRCSADFFLIGTDSIRALLPPKLAVEPVPKRPEFISSSLNGRISPLLAPRVILGDETVLRVQFISEKDRMICAVDCPVSEPAPALERVRSSLQEILPFADFTLSARSLEEPVLESGSCNFQGFPGARVGLRAGKNLFFCSGAGVLPTLGATGEVLVGATIASHLQENT